MCGIFGYNEKIGTDENIFFELMSHRGPDAKSSARAGDWLLGHLRLSIIDTTEAANQPFEKDGSFIVFNGEIYNYLELKGEYLRDVNLKTTSDTEVLIELLNRHGEKILNKLNGMFAFAWYDSGSGRLMLVRDRYGVKPLYWMENGGKFYFSSELKPLIRVKGKIEFNGIILDSFFKDTATDFDKNTFVRGIFYLEAGHRMTVGKDGSLDDRAWYQGSDFEFDREVFNDKQATVDYFENLLTDAVRIRHRSDVPVCITLSGGLDSTAIYVLAKEKLKSKIKPFVFSHAGAATDEAPKAMRLAKEYQDEPIVVESRSEQGIRSLNEASDFLEFPIWNPSAIAYLDMYKEIKKKGFKVVIEGHGSDEQLGGYPYMIEAAWKELLLKGKWGRAHEIYRIFRETQNPVLEQAEKGGSNTAADIFDMARGLGRGIIKAILMPSKAKYLKMQALLDDSFSYKILPIVLRAFDRLPMSQSIESRCPFMDFRIVEFIRSMPLQYKVSKIGSKAILREILKKYNKDYIYMDKAKMGFASDLPALFNEPINKSYFKKMIDEFNLPQFAKRKSKAEKLINKDRIGWSDVDQIWKVASIEMIKEKYAR